MDIVQAAQSYLADDPSDWSVFVRRLNSSIGRWGESTIDRSVGSRLEDCVLPALFSTELVRSVASSDSGSAAIECLETALSSLLSSVPIDVEQRHEFQPLEEYWNEIIDFDDNYNPVPRIDGDFDGDLDTLPIAHSYRPVELNVDIGQLSELIGGVLRKRKSKREDDRSSIFRLDIIDVALYRALIGHPELLRTLDWRTFEKLLADILEEFEYEVELQQGTKDGGVDIIAVKRHDPLGPQKFLLQAKRYKNKVGVEPVRQLAFLHHHHRVTKSCLATTSLFTRGAWELANDYKWQMELRDFDGIHRWIQEAAERKNRGRTKR